MDLFLGSVVLPAVCLSQEYESVVLRYQLTSREILASRLIQRSTVDPHISHVLIAAAMVYTRFHVDSKHLNVELFWEGPVQQYATSACGRVV